MAADPQPRQSKKHNSFHRIATLKKKASQLSALCDVPVCVLGFTPDGDLFTWPEQAPEVKSTLHRYKQAIVAAGDKKGSKKRPFCDAAAVAIGGEPENADLEGFLGCKKSRVWEETKQGVSDGNSASTVQSVDTALALPNWVDEGFLGCLGSKLQAVDEKVRVLEERKQSVGDVNYSAATVQSEDMALALPRWVDEGFLSCLESKLQAVDEKIRALEEKKQNVGDANSAATVQSEDMFQALLQWTDEGFFDYEFEIVDDKIRVLEETKQSVVDVGSAATVQFDDMALASPQWIDECFFGRKLETVDGKIRVLEEEKQSVGDASSAATVQYEDLALALPQWSDDEFALELDDFFWCLPCD